MPSPGGRTLGSRLRGFQLLEAPSLNKGTAFTQAERAALGLEGLLPPSVETIERQTERALHQVAQKQTNLGRYIYLLQLLDANETLFYRVVMSDPARFLPILYAPTVGEACLAFGHIYRRPRGMYVTINQKGRVRQLLGNWPEKDVRVICVSTGERVLGLGDLGTNGMGIPIGKLQMYTACAAVPPRRLLPVLLDCGTNNRALLDDPLYLGSRQSRPSDDEMNSFVDEFVEAVQDVFPNCCIHFEDWKGTDALRYLARYRDKVSCFNDDIQGTGGVVLAGLLNALRIKQEKLSDQRILFLGAGSAAIGIADMLVSAMSAEGVKNSTARECISLFDVKGLVEPSRDDLIPEQEIYAHPHAPTRDFLAAINSIRPTVLIGASTVGKAFNQPVVEGMSLLNARPVIFALSNPTKCAECTAEEAYTWSRGKAIFAAGVQFPSVQFAGKKYVPGQANNFYIFPAVGLAIYATNARRVTDEMFIEAARATADQVTDAQRARGMVFPPQNNLLETEIRTAERVAAMVFDQNLARVERPENINTWLRAQLYRPEYSSRPGSVDR